MVEAPPDWEWGSWVLGDLADIVRRACDVLGSATDVARVVVSPPSLPDGLPEVRVGVRNEFVLRSIRGHIAEGEYSASFFGRPTDGCWIAEVAGLRIYVGLTEGAS
jgi:hypothetical protein